MFRMCIFWWTFAIRVLIISLRITFVTIFYFESIFVWTGIFYQEETLDEIDFKLDYIFILNAVWIYIFLYVYLNLSYVVGILHGCQPLPIACWSNRSWPLLGGRGLMSSFEAGIQLSSRNCVSSWLIMLFCMLIFLLFSSLKFLKISRSSFLPCGFRIIYVLILSEQLHRLCFRSMCYEFIF